VIPVSRIRSRALIAAVTLLSTGVPAAAQHGSGSSNGIQIDESLALTTDSVAFMDVPFELGEELTYEVKFGWWTVGEGFLKTFDELETIRGNPSYRVQMGLEGKSGGASVDYKFDSWMDVRTLASHRYIQNQQGFNSRYREYDIFPKERRWHRLDHEDSGLTPSDVPLDQVSFIWFVRTLPLEVGDEYVLNQYFKEEDNPVIIRVLRRETIEVPAGTFDCIVIEPIIKTSGLFGDGGQAEIYFTDDDRRLMVYMKSRVKILPDIHLRLKEIG
jgi:hypothetical protein